MPALTLALHSINEAMDLSATLDGNEVDPTYQLMLSADFAHCAHNAMIEGVTYHFHHDAVFAAILANGSIPDHLALRREAIEDHQRSKSADRVAA